MILLSTQTLLFVLIGVIIVLIGLVIRMEMRLSRILRGKSGKDLEENFISLSKDIENLKVFEAESMGYMRNIEGRLKRSIQAVETIRFNPFKGTGSGGNQSFATAFINEKGDGLMLSSLYSREHVSVYAKPLKKLGSEFELSAEEKSAIDAAKNTLAYQTNNER